jgi:hypothetical protein
LPLSKAIDSAETDVLLAKMEDEGGCKKSLALTGVGAELSNDPNGFTFVKGEVGGNSLFCDGLTSGGLECPPSRAFPATFRVPNGLCAILFLMDDVGRG